jgi:hypothetical protein
MNVREWLRGGDLGQYEEKFRDNKIDLDVLADLSDGDLEKLGIPLGDRKRLLKAIAELASRDPLSAQARLVAAAPISPAQSFAHPDAAVKGKPYHACHGCHSGWAVAATPIPPLPEPRRSG